MKQSQQASFSQQRLWFLDQLEPGQSGYNLANAMRITGILDVDALAKALQAVVERHESLRMTFGEEGDVVMAFVAEALEPFQLPVVSFDHLPAEQREEAALQLAAEEGQRPFDLGAGPLIRAKILRLSRTDNLLVLTIHHIVTDGWSIGLLLNEMASFYRTFQLKQAPQVPLLPVRYSDFAAWQREVFNGDAASQQLEYWKRTLSGAPNTLDLPADRLRPAVQSHKGRRHSVRLDAKLAKEVAGLSLKEHATPFMVLLAAFETLLFRYTGLTDFVLGTPMAGRSHVEFEPLIGLFVNTVPLRADLSGDPTFRALLHRVRDSALDAQANQDVPFERLVEELKPQRSASHPPLFQTMFILHNSPRTAFDFAGLHFEELEFDSGLSKFDLTLEIFESEGLCCTWEYSTDLFDHGRIVRMAEHFETLLRGICAEPGQTLSALPILCEAQRNRVLIEWNDTASVYPNNVCIHEEFEAQVVRSPNSIAVRSDDDHLTYQQLNEEANCLSHYLIKHGVRPQDRVGVAVERSPAAVVALLAVMKAGASYVPIDPAHPKQRIAFILKDSGARVVITQQRLRMRLPDHDGETIFLDNDRAGILVENRVNPQLSADSRSPAYVIYTSGSTGEPKGVLGTHRASLNRFAWMWNAYPFRAGEVCAQRTTLSFVDSIAEIFCPLLRGIPIFIMPDEAAIDPDELLGKLSSHQITRIVVVPSQLGLILQAYPDSDRALSSLRLCFTSGEALPYQLSESFAKLLPHATLINLYGSSEVAADVTCFETSSATTHCFVPIGKPIANVRVYLLDPSLNPVPIGVPGEICVAGDCLALGYLGRPELTAERFVADPFRKDGLLCKTGDLGRYHEDGNIEFLGRLDSQVKIRGLRIEPGEIEAALRTHASVRQSVVLIRANGSMDPLLVGFVVPAEGQAVIPSELRRHLKTSLPDYMIPSVFVTLDSLPMTPNGKLDKRALAGIEPGRPQMGEDFVAPRNEVEAKLVEIWTEVLKVERIGVLDNFFELGGHSLLASQVIARVRKYMGVEVPLRSLFDEPNVAALARALEKARHNGAALVAKISPGKLVDRAREYLAMRLVSLSDEEVDALLTTVLARRDQDSGSSVDWFPDSTVKPRRETVNPNG